MYPFEVTILGSNSALPAHGRHPSAQFININHHSILVDCGEGTQIRLRENEKTNIYHISHIFISHIHGDHCLGLMGLVNTLKLLNREKPLFIFAHQRVIEMFRFQAEKMNFRASFKIYFHIVPEIGSGQLYNHADFVVHFFQLNHRISCTGYKFSQKYGKKKVNIEQLEKYNIPKENWNAIQSGANFQLPDGRTISHEELTQAHPAAKTYAYCSDTRYTEQFLSDIQNTDLAYIESTFTGIEQELANQRYHCTSYDAAKIARNAGVKKLIIGHFTSRYKDVSIFQKEAKEIFDNTELALEGETFIIN